MKIEAQNTTVAVIVLCCAFLLSATLGVLSVVKNRRLENRLGETEAALAGLQASLAEHQSKASRDLDISLLTLTGMQDNVKELFKMQTDQANQAGKAKDGIAKAMGESYKQIDSTILQLTQGMTKVVERLQNVEAAVTDEQKMMHDLLLKLQERFKTYDRELGIKRE